MNTHLILRLCINQNPSSIDITECLEVFGGCILGILKIQNRLPSDFLGREHRRGSNRGTRPERNRAMYRTDYSSKKSSGTPIYHGSRVIGKVLGDKFRKTIRFSRHALRQPPALALSIDSLIQAERAGAEWVEIYDIESKTTFRASIDHIRKAGKRIERGGYEPQLALGLDDWTKQSPGSGSQPPLF